jgi:oxygen-independent coproporphyrinogen III oxidase
MKHLYVHIPFCRSRCAYCDFASEPVGPHSRAGRVERYFEAVRAELKARVAAGDGAAAPGGDVAQTGGGAAGARRPEAEPLGAEPLETIYLGGGTPTAVPPDLLVPFVAELGAGMSPQAEFSVEANPGTIDTRLLQRLAEGGVTRLSVGIQSFAPALRAALGRRVTQREIEGALEAIVAVGWEEWNLDLIFGIPGQTWDTAAADLDTAIAAAPTHISLYDLTYTPAFRARIDARPVTYGRRAAGGASAGRVAADSADASPSAVDAAEAFSERYYGAAVARLEAAGYRRYEVSNFSLPGHECRHNQAYWRGEDYLGIGASAVSTIGEERRTNPRSVSDYLAGRPTDVELLSPGTRLFEKAMLGLRTSEGIDEAEALPALDAEALERLVGQGCLERRYGRIRLNKGFLDVSNAVISALLVQPPGPGGS